MGCSCRMRIGKVFMLLVTTVGTGSNSEGPLVVSRILCLKYIQDLEWTYIRRWVCSGMTGTYLPPKVVGSL
jgi:hypothetical protein